MDETAYSIAVRYLGYRPRSIKEIRDQLTKKKIPHEQIEAVIKKLLAQKFLNDEEFARIWVRSRVARKPKSQRILYMELRAKGIENNIIETVLSEIANQGGNDYEMIKLLVQKKRDRYKNMTKDERYRKLGSFLKSKGFSYDLIKRVIDENFRS